MNMPPGSRLETVLDEFAERHGALARVREQMRVLSVTARSRDDAVEVTVDAAGRPAGVRIVDSRFRGMQASQLGDSVLEALTTARAEATARATALLLAATPRRRPLPSPPEPVVRPQGPLWGRNRPRADGRLFRTDHQRR